MAVQTSKEIISQLQCLLGDLSEDDCQVLVEEYGAAVLDSGAILDNIYEALESSGFEKISELIWHIKENPCFTVRRSRSLREKNSNDSGSWSLARSKSSSTINKFGNSPIAAQPQRSASVCPQLEPQTEDLQALPFGGTRNPIEIVRFQKGVDPGKLRKYLSNYLQDPELRNILFDIHDKKATKVLILMRGPSGSGKSTLASTIWAITDKGEICSADHYFINRHGQYNFTRGSLGEAHESCRNRCRSALQRGESPIIIDNTNTKMDEMMPYVDMAIDYNYEIKLLEPKTEWRNKPHLLAQKTVHGVPKRSIQDQLERFEKTTAKVMVEKVMKKRGIPNAKYRPTQGLEWGNETAVTPAWTAGTCSPLPSTYQHQSAVPQATAQITFPTVSNSAKLLITPSLPTASNSWIQTPTSTTPAPILVSDLVPDLTHGSPSHVSKTKRAGKRNGSGNSSNYNVTAEVNCTPLVFVDPAHIEFEKLCKHFPSVPKDELEKLFNLYEGDINECASVLIEEGRELVSVEENMMTDSELLPSQIPFDVGASNKIMSDQTGMHFESGFSISPDGDITFNDAVINDALMPFCAKSDDTDDSSEFSATTDEDSDAFKIVLPVEFGKLLLKAFGHPDDEDRELSQEELTLKIGSDVAFELYKSLYINMHRTEINAARSNTEDTPPSTPSTSSESDEDEFNAIAISLSQMEMETQSGDPQLASIMDLEEKLSISTQESLRRFAAPNRNMAQTLRFNMLKQDYPMLDPAFLDEVYSQCHLDKDRTEVAIREIYCYMPQRKEAQNNTQRASGASGTWNLRYNPTDAHMYTPEQIKEIKKAHGDLEKQWTYEMAKFKEYHAKCQNVGSPQIKAHYLSEAKKTSESMKNVFDEMQYYKAITQNAKRENLNVLDLHGLKVHGAMRVLKEFLQFKEAEFIDAGVPKMFLKVITGQGKHSPNGYPVLQPAVKNFLIQRKVTFIPMPGSFKIILTRNSVGVGHK